ncbi:pYEATS domain-containing protein [Candidatus Electronema sp. JM]|uniref:pYEATS domain-containing protein n=1 Tax=Candidatus Electronema sp. JM TaxID=3401571 RepID=UPI003AA89D16
MKMWQTVAMVLALLVAAGAAQAQGGRRDAERQAEADGWQVAYGNELTGRDMERGEVQRGVSIFSARGTAEMGRLHDWADALLGEAASRARISNFDQKDRFQAMRFTVRTVRELIRNRRAGSDQTTLGNVEVKAGLLEYSDWSRDSWGGRRAETVFVPYVGMKASWNGGAQQEPYNPSYQPPMIQSDPSGQSSADIMNAFSLKNTARNIGGGRWQWTAYIDGPKHFLRRISAVTYYLHPTFKPSTQLGDSSKLGHPLTATGWGAFTLRAEVALDDGTRRIYEHTLRFR